MQLSKVFERIVLAEVERLPRAPQGRPLKFSDANALEIMFKVLRTGMQWREVVAPVCYTTVFRRFQTWHLRGIFRDAYKKVLQTHAKLQRPRFYCVDSSYVRNRHCQVGTGRNHTDRGRQALKLSVLTDDGGVVHAARLDAGNRPDVCLLGATLAAALVRLDRLPLYADRGYDSRNNRGVVQRCRVARSHLPPQDEDVPSYQCPTHRRRAHFRMVATLQAAVILLRAISGAVSFFRPPRARRSRRPTTAEGAGAGGERRGGGRP